MEPFYYWVLIALHILQWSLIIGLWFKLNRVADVVAELVLTYTNDLSERQPGVKLSDIFKDTP